MPTVWVFPPEDDLEEPWVLFDADFPGSDSDSELDAESDLVHNNLQPDTPPFHRNFTPDDLVMPRKSIDVAPFSNAIDDLDNYPDYDHDITIRGNEPGDFSEIIEVIKVKRHSNDREAQSQATPKPPKASIKRSETFLSKASRAFRSIRNVSRPVPTQQEPLKPRTSDVSAPRDSTKSKTATLRSTVSSVSSATDPTTPKKRRRGSIALSQIFSSPTNKSRDSSETCTPRPVSIISQPSSSSLFTTYTSSESIAQGNIENFPEIERSSSPTPSTRTFSSRRFSVLNLFSKGEVSDEPDPSPPSLSRDSLGPSSVSTCSSSSGPPTPVTPGDSFPPPVPPKVAVPLLKRIPSFMRKDNRDSRKSVFVPPTPEPAPLDAGDISFEMRLDSLHFDDLSFDADQFR